MAEIIPNDYTKEYNEAIQKINDLEQKLADAYVYCEHVCLTAAKSNWSIKSPEKMAIFCASIINRFAKSQASVNASTLVGKYDDILHIVNIDDYTSLKTWRKRGLIEPWKEKAKKEVEAEEISAIG